MFLRYLKAQLWVLLCGGLVGPIFLVVYFATGKQDPLGWMLWLGLLITAADISIALALNGYASRSAAKARALEQSGVLALARITGMSETGTLINNRPLVKLQLHIEGPGVAPFVTEDRVIASIVRLPNITSRQLVVLVDPATREYRIDWERSSLINGLVPAQFTLSDDNKTYDLSGQVEPLMEILAILKAHNITVNRMVDVRTNPAARQQLQAVVRRAVAHQAQAPQQAAAPSYPPGSAPGGAGPRASIAERLQELETLRATGVVTAEEYSTRRTQIIAEI